MTTIVSQVNQLTPLRNPPSWGTPDPQSGNEPRPCGVIVLESCHSTWVFDSRRMRFCRILKGIEFASHAVSTAWRPYWRLDLDTDGEGFTVYLNADRNRLIRSWRHTKDCSQCEREDAEGLAIEALRRAVPR